MLQLETERVFFFFFINESLRVGAACATGWCHVCVVSAQQWVLKRYRNRCIIFLLNALQLLLNFKCRFLLFLIETRPLRNASAYSRQKSEIPWGSAWKKVFCSERKNSNKMAARFNEREKRIEMSHTADKLWLICRFPYYIYVLLRPFDFPSVHDPKPLPVCLSHPLFIQISLFQPPR